MLAVRKTFLLCISFLILCYTSLTQAQEGPGGIEDTSGTSSLFLWLDANRIEGVSDLNTISSWEDVSGYNHHVSNANANSKPHLRESILNGFPVVGFDGSSEHLDGNFGGSFGSPSTVIVVPFFDDINQTASENAYVISIGSGSGTRNHFSIGRRNSGGSDGNKYYSWINDGSPKLGDTIVGQTWNIITQVNASTAPFHSMYLNGTASSSLTDYSGTITTDGIFRVGQWYNGGTNRLDGRLAEVIVFNKTLAAVELNIIQSYLSAKYAISISNDLYNGDEVINGNNDFDVMGIGMESDVSHSVIASAGLQLGISQDFENTDYVMLGHNVLVNSINSADVNGSLVSRWDRAWWLDITNTGANVVCNFTFSQIDGEVGFGDIQNSNEDYKLIYRSSTSGNWSVVATANATTNNKIIFNDVELNLDGYYTVATINANSKIGVSPVSTGDKGPGGVGGTDGSSNLKLWYNIGSLEVSDGDQVLSIADQSGSGNKVTQETFINIPSYEANKVNSNSAIAFNGANSYLGGTLGFNAIAPLTVFSVGYFNKINQGNEDNDYIYSIGTGLSRGDQISISRRKSNDEDDVANINKYYSWDGDTARFGNTINGQTWYAFTQEYFPVDSSLLHRARFNGSNASATDNETIVNTNDNTISIGRWNGNNHWLDGSFSELIIYNRNLNAAERTIVESYLGGKYNLIVSGDKYNGDDFSNGDNDLDIAGIGTEANGSNLSANSAGLILEQVSGFANGDYIMVGHSVETNSINTTDVTDDLGNNEARWNRAWYMDVTNTGDDPIVNIRFDFSDVNAEGFPSSESSNYYSLLYRSGTSGTWTNLNSNPTINGDQVVYNNITLSSDGFFTLGSSQITNGPLPITLLDFTLFNDYTTTKIDWTTASEINNDYFLLEKSLDAIHYNTIAKITGAGNSTTDQNYSVLDENIHPEKTYYYQLRQFDFDGKSEVFGPIVSKKITQERIIKISPNPADEYINIYGISETSKIRLSDIHGNLVYDTDLIQEENIQINTIDLKAGIYFLQITKTKMNEIHKIILK